MAQTIQEFAAEREFFTSRRAANKAANGRQVDRLGHFAYGSWGLYPRGMDGGDVMEVFAVRKPQPMPA
ncbi:MAG TPA: hypothetical protein VMY37_27820 [Thermoguttaceae bacterium]|nr:hypothetical protein [Thermoguttaceae bacterium]